VNDRELVERQLGRAPRAFRRVAVRCPYGAPAVTEQWAYDERGEPFPTTYYLTCRHLVAAIARVEAAGGVERWSGELARDRALAESLEAAHERQRMLRHDLVRTSVGTDAGASLRLGIGGAATDARGLKCLHAHAAFALANPRYELGERILEDVGPLWPPDGCCTLERGH
jgi:hypothetical protein